jgi:multidrug transporter EmrE-like cation transporter
MSLPQIISLSIIEIIGDFGLKQFANQGGILSLSIGILGYIGVVGMLIVSLQNSTILMVNGAWDGISTLLESIAAYFFLGERLDNYLQYFGLLFIILGIFLLKIPLTKNHPFHIPKL